jgi:hypothetical protein
VLLAHVGGGLARIRSDLHRGFRPTGPDGRPLTRLVGESPDLFPRYAARLLEAKILVRFDERGRLLRGKPGETWLRGDLRLRLEEERPGLEVTLALPDVLTEGRPFFDDFLESLLTDDARSAIVDAYRKLRERDVRAFLSNLEPSGCVLVRIDSEDRDVVLLRGFHQNEPAALLMGVKFNVEGGFPELEVEPEEIVDIGHWVGEPVPDHLVSHGGYAYGAHFRRLFGLLLRWLGDGGGA